jgi:hypothetical protein
VKTPCYAMFQVPSTLLDVQKERRLLGSASYDLFRNRYRVRSQLVVSPITSD